DEGLATTLLANLLKNAFVHNVQEGRIVVRGNGNALVLANTGVETALPAGQIFRRFYHTSGSGGGTGLGLALAEAVCRRLNLHIGYTFHEGMHTFTLQRKAADDRP
ncbi:MAG: ATP-binding protein, partial [Bacteroidales bacterium]|nr:ATP-binding protein [Bacteroidales bacterium]